MRKRPRLMRVSTGVASAAAVAGALLVAGEATSARSCSRFEGRVLVQTKSARITSVRGDGFRTWHGCLDRSGRRVHLGIHDPTGAVQLGRPMLAGRFAAFERFVPSTGPATATAVVVDLAARRRASVDVPGDITGMVLSGRGDLVVTSPDAVLHLRRGRAVATLDTGDIRPRSLALSPDGRFAYWQSAGQPRAFELPR